MFTRSSPEKTRIWEERILQQQKSKLSVERWCRDNQVAAYQFYYWKSKLFSKQITTSSFTELPQAKNVGVTIDCDGMRIHLDPDFDAVTLKRCLVIIKELRC